MAITDMYSQHHQHSTKHMLLVEDDCVDARMVHRTCDELDLQCRLTHVRNGEEALQFLDSTVIANRPDIILLDINMPRMNGIEFLEIIKSHEKFRYIPVVVLTTSNERQDKEAVFKHSVAGYMVKPVEHERFVEVMHTISQYWSLSEVPY